MSGLLNCVTAYVQKARLDPAGATSDEDSLNDNASVISIVSDQKSVIEEGRFTIIIRQIFMKAGCYFTIHKVI